MMEKEPNQTDAAGIEIEDLDLEDSDLGNSDSGNPDFGDPGRAIPDSEDPDAGHGEKTAGTASSGRRRAAKRFAAAAAVIAVLLGTAYCVKAQEWTDRFLPNTSVNSVDVSGLTALQAEKLFDERAADYRITIHAREQDDAVLSGEDAGLSFAFGETFRNLIESQNIYTWFSRLNASKEYEIDTIASVDDAVFQKAVDSLPCMREADFRQPEDAHLKTDSRGVFSVVPEVRGTALDREAAAEAIREAVCALKPEISLEDAGVYEEPAVLSDDPGLLDAVEAANRYTETVITYESGDGTVLDGSTIRGWIKLNSDNTVSLDSEAIRSFVSDLSKQYDTYGKAKPFHTSWGQDITVKGGTYGWKVDQAAEAEWLAGTIPTGQKVSRMPAFSRTAASHGAADYGNTYVEVNLTAQHLYFYKDGKQIVSSDFVSGNVSRGTVTHTGVYQIAYKQRDATLKGENYSSHVNFWMPFNRGEGLHDALWRSSFGGSIYLTSGSHGCVNLPYSAAEQIFENISAGTPVIVYELPGTESAAKSAAASDSSAETSSQAAAESRSQTDSEKQSQAAAESEPQASRESSSQPAAEGSSKPASGNASQPAGPAETAPAAESSASQAPSGGTVKPSEETGETREIGPGITDASEPETASSAGLVTPAGPGS